MKFVCDKCQTQYMISDDKVEHKSVKVRCKRCGNMILLRSTSDRTEVAAANPLPTTRVSKGIDDTAVPSGDELGEAFDQLVKDGLDSQPANETDERQTEIVNLNELDRLRAQSTPALPEHEQKKIEQAFTNIEDRAASPTEQPETFDDWYAAIDGKQVGPLSVADLKEKVTHRVIDANGLVWRQGMEDWQALKDIPHLQQLLGLNLQSTEKAAEDTMVGAAASESPPPKSGGDFSLSALVEKELAAVTDIPLANQEAPQKPASVLSTLVSDELPPWERRETAAAPVAEKHETTFQTHQTGFNQVIVKPKYLGGGKNSTRTIIIGSVIAAALILVVSLVVYHVRTRSQADTGDSDGLLSGRSTGLAAGAPAPNLKLQIGSAPATTPAATSDTPKEDSKSARDDQAEKKETDIKKTETTVEKSSVVVPEIKEAKATASPNDLSNKSTQPVAAKAPAKRSTSPKTSSEDTEARSSGTLPKTLTNDQIKGVIRGKIDQMKNCVEQQQQRDPSVTGTMLVSFVIEKTGRVSTINMLSEEHRGTFVAGCIASVIKTMKFPRFTGDPVEVPRLPLKLGG